MLCCKDCLVSPVRSVSPVRVSQCVQPIQPFRNSALIQYSSSASSASSASSHSSQSSRSSYCSHSSHSSHSSQSSSLSSSSVLSGFAMYVDYAQNYSPPMRSHVESPAESPAESPPTTLQRIRSLHYSPTTTSTLSQIHSIRRECRLRDSPFSPFSPVSQSPMSQSPWSFPDRQLRRMPSDLLSQSSSPSVLSSLSPSSSPSSSSSVLPSTIRPFTYISNVECSRKTLDRFLSQVDNM